MPAPTIASPVRTRRRFLHHGLCAVSALLVTVAGCGGGGEPSAESATSTATSTGAQSVRARAVPSHAPAAVASPKRLKPQGRDLVDPSGQTVYLHGANLRDNLTPGGKSKPILTPAEADDLANHLSFNFVRLRISHEGANLDDQHESGLSQAARDALADAVSLLSARRIWTLLEMRTDDDTANRKAFYTPGNASFERYRKTWVWLAKTYRHTDYIAGYGLLAEPSPDKDRSETDPVGTLIRFQASLMAAIDQEDGVTPFFVGPAFNYDTLGYRWDAYFTDPQLQPYRSRLVYEVNMLSPKSWITQAQAPDGTGGHAWPQPAVSDFSALLEVKPGEDYVRPRDDESIFSKRSKEMGNFPLVMSLNYADWYLEPAARFADEHKVPMVLDQFGATTEVNLPQRRYQQLRYEHQIIDTAARKYRMGWSRWLYSADAMRDRSIAGNPDVHQFYRHIGSQIPGP